MKFWIILVKMVYELAFLTVGMMDEQYREEMREQVKEELELRGWEENKIINYLEEIGL